MLTIDKKFHELCNEIDGLKETIIYWKNKYKIINEEYNKLLNLDMNEKKLKEIFKD